MEQPFITDLSLLIDYDIRVFKIKDAVIEILMQKEIISRSAYYFLKVTNEDTRSLFISGVLKNKNLNKLISNQIKETNNQFLIANNLQSTDILEIDEDNIILKNRIPKVTKLGQLEYEFIDHFSNFINIDSIRIYTIEDMLGNKIKVNGFNNCQQEQLHSAMINAIIQSISILSSNGAMPALQFIRQLYNDYNSYKLPIEYYRAFNLNSSFTIKSGIYSYEVFSVSEKDKTSLDISYNRKVIEKLFSIIVQLSFLME